MWQITQLLPGKSAKQDFSLLEITWPGYYKGKLCYLINTVSPVGKAGAGGGAHRRDRGRINTLVWLTVDWITRQFIGTRVPHAGNRHKQSIIYVTVCYMPLWLWGERTFHIESNLFKVAVGFNWVYLGPRAIGWEFTFKKKKKSVVDPFTRCSEWKCEVWNGLFLI